MESVQQGAAVQLTIPDVGVFQIPIVRRPLPRRGGFSMLYRCPGCGQPRRYLYLRSLVIGRLVDYQGPLCQACAGLRWASQGRYLGVHRLPFPRHPRDPRAVSAPADPGRVPGPRRRPANWPGPGLIATVDKAAESDVGGGSACIAP